MKKISFLVLLVIFYSPLAIYAASIGDAETQGQFKFGIGIDQEFIFNRDLKLKSASPPLFIIIPGLELNNIEMEKMYRTMLKGSFGLLDFLDIYFKLGMADYKFNGDFDLTGQTIQEIETKTNWRFAYGGGIKAAHAFKNGLLIGGDLQYLRHKNKIREKFTDPATGLDTTAPIRGKATYQEWHAAPYIGMKIGNFTPYLGGKYSDVRIKTKDDSGQNLKLKADNRFGAFVGVTYHVIKNLKLNLEGRFFDETALSFGISYLF